MFRSVQTGGQVYYRMRTVYEGVAPSPHPGTYLTVIVGVRDWNLVRCRKPRDK